MQFLFPSSRVAEEAECLVYFMHIFGRGIVFIFYPFTHVIICS